MAIFSELNTHLSMIWGALRHYFDGRRLKQRHPVADPVSLRWFLSTRASHVAQTSLYGYLRTRAGVRFPELFHDDTFVASINIAKWQLWLACLSDLGVYTGGLIFRRGQPRLEQVDRLMTGAIASILDETGLPEDAGPEFNRGAEQVKARLLNLNWGAVGDDETAFRESPTALVRWAPIVDELKQLDEEIVTNSVRFRWNEVRRDLRELLDAKALLHADEAAGTGPDRAA